MGVYIQQVDCDFRFILLYIRYSIITMKKVKNTEKIKYDDN